MRLTFLLIILTIFLIPCESAAQNYYWVAFKDKANSPFSLLSPQEYLSEKAIERRNRQSIAIDSLDLPVNSSYIEQITQLGATFVHASKWLNGITVKVFDTDFPKQAMNLPFVKEVQLTKRSGNTKSATNKFESLEGFAKKLEIDSSLYGESVHQVAQINGQFLHNQNFMGQEMMIAVLDAGFYRVDQFAVFDSLWMNGQIAGRKSFVFTHEEEDFFEGHYHGMSVLSIMGGNSPGELIGTAPKATYWLIRSEDHETEFLIEEDNWVAAAEFADSVGADIINSSLGYFTFNDPAMNHTYAEMDGKTTRAARSANIASSRGMLVFASAGNEGNSSWKYIITPSDADSVIAVGAVNKLGVPAPFTSYGPASDGDVKPNVSALGWNTIIQRSNGTIGTGNGTSYSSPVLAGAAACLWQANPAATASQVKSAIEQSANLFPNADTLVGYGIPDMVLADRILKESVLKKWKTDAEWLVYPNPAMDYLVLQKQNILKNQNVQIAFYTIDGKLLRKEEKSEATRIILQNLRNLPQGLLILHIISDDKAEAVKIRITP